MTKLGNISLKKKITGSFLIVFLSFILIGSLIYNGIQKIEHLNFIISKENGVLSYVHQTRQNNLSVRYRAARLFLPNKEKAVVSFSEKCLNDIEEIASDLAAADSIFKMIKSYEPLNLQEEFSNIKDSTTFLTQKISKPSIEKSVILLTQYGKTWKEFEDYLDSDSIEISEVQRYRNRIDDLEDDFKKNRSKVYSNYKLINAAIKRLRDSLEASISQNQAEIESIITSTKAMVLVTVGFALLLILMVNSFLHRIIIEPIMLVISFLKEFAGGRIPTTVLKESDDEIGEMAREINTLKASLEASTNFAESIGNGHFTAKFEAQDALGKSLIIMRESLQKSYEEEKARTFVSQGLTQINQVLSKQSGSILEFTNNVVRFIIDYLNFKVGAFYVTYSDKDTHKIKLEGCYAYDRTKQLEQTIEIGHGLVGQAYLEKESMYLDTVPAGFIQIASGLGNAKPSSICVIPLVQNDKVHGIMEFASFNKISDVEKQFLEAATESISSVLSAIKINIQTAELLEETQDNSEMMQAQEEEMRQNMEELQATQEEMIRKEKEYQNRISELEGRIS